MIRCAAGPLAHALRQAVLPEGALVFVARVGMPDEWVEVSGELMEAFTLTQTAARSGGPVIYVIDGDALLGRGGRGPAMVACGLLSAARTLALETEKAGPVNVVALAEGTSPDLVRSWVEMLCRPDGPRGELIRLGSDHVGKTLP